MTANPASPAARAIAAPRRADRQRARRPPERYSVEVIKRLMTNGVMAAMNQTIDYDTAAIVAVELGFDPQEEPLAASRRAAEAVFEDEDDRR